SERVYKCPCGFVLDRDHNSAINIKNEGLRLFALS
ncbi:zinc ribbon domain-containing protein, partial [Weizmannia sp. CD-2023]